MLINEKTARIMPIPTHREICQYQGRNNIAMNNDIPILTTHSRGDMNNHLDVKKVLKPECVSNLLYCEKDLGIIFLSMLNLNSPLLVGVKRKFRLSGQRGMISNKS